MVDFGSRCGWEACPFFGPACQGRRTHYRKVTAHRTPLKCGRLTGFEPGSIAVAEHNLTNFGTGLICGRSA